MSLVWNFPSLQWRGILAKGLSVIEPSSILPDENILPPHDEICLHCRIVLGVKSGDSNEN